MINSGSGRFNLGATLAVGAAPRSVAAADVNGDGKVDLISANSSANTVTVLTNNGSGGFVLAGTFGVGAVPRCVAAADMNGDGKLDVNCANYSDNTVTVLTNNGSGGFALAAAPAVGSFPVCVATADVNGDGTADLVSANWGAGTLTILTNPPAGVRGTFTGDGSGLTGLDASELVSGTLPLARLPASVLTNGTSPVTFGSRPLADSQAVILRVLGDNNVNWKGAAAFGHSNAAVIVGELGTVATVGAHTPNLGAWANLALNPDGGNVGIGIAAPTSKLHVNGNIYATGTITPNSDRNLKTKFAPVDVQAVLDRVAALPIQQWRFQAEPDGVKHVGPMAQDFRAAFGLGEIPTAIATVDADGVALAAIQGLNEVVKEKEARILELERSMAELKSQMKALAETVNGVGR